MNPIFCAVDTPNIEKAEKLVDSLKESVGGIKLGLEFFMATGPEGYRKIAKKGLSIFLDLKLHDIPNTVAGAISSLLPLKPSFITVHASGGPAMLRAASDAAAKAGVDRPKLLAVTVLTSLDKDDLTKVGQGADVAAQVVRLAEVAKDSGIDGVICAPAEIPALRKALGKDFILMVPGIRPDWASSDDQKRAMTPKEAHEAGASYLVIGRPITKAEDPAAAAKRILAELT
jgi:orotidine-5'-phosphate decarboxylase